MAFFVSDLCDPALDLYNNSRGIESFPYAVARRVAEQFNIEILFFQAYGLESEWEDEEYGITGIDVGEFILWVHDMIITHR